MEGMAVFSRVVREGPSQGRLSGDLREARAQGYIRCALGKAW